MAGELLVSTRKGLFVYSREGNSWKLTAKSFLGDNVTLARVDRRTGRWHAALNLGHFGVKLHTSTDGGKTWTEAAVPAYPEGEFVHTADGKPPNPATLKLVWAIEPGGDDQPGRLWAGTLPGGLFRSDDDGQSWQLVRSLWDMEDRKKWFGGGADHPGIHSICIDPRDSKHIRLAVSCGGAWISKDDGQTWQVGTGMRAEYMPPDLQLEPVIQDPHLMVQCPAAPDHLWVQHHNGIFNSTDGGHNWSEIKDVKPSVFGFAVAVHPRDPNTAWFVPAIKDERRIPVDGKLVVTRTRNGGKTFETLDKGLPEDVAYDLVFRHALAIDDSGDTLAMGSTTGGLWVTQDQGDNWSQLNGRLPPIHAVTFL